MFVKLKIVLLSAKQEEEDMNWLVTVIVNLLPWKDSAEDSNLYPVFDVIPRCRCPFYGFQVMEGGWFLSAGGNQCALIVKRYSPCSMEMQHNNPDWDTCPFGGQMSEDDWADIFQEGQVFAPEFRPPNQDGWEGLPFKVWLEYVMGDQVPRPETCHASAAE